MNTTQLKLTSTEIGALWGQYVNESMVNQVNKYMLSIIEDTSIREVFNDAIKISENQMQQVSTFMLNDGFPLPIGFTEADTNPNIGRLFSDIFCLDYLYLMTIHGLNGHIYSLTTSVRKDLRDFFDSCLTDGKNMYQRTVDLLLEKGHFQRDPYFFPRTTPEFIDSKKYLDGFWGDKRPLSAIEIGNISLNLKKSIMAKTLGIAFSQIAGSKEIRKFLTDAVQTSNDHIQLLSKKLKDDNLPVPMSWETEITESTDSPFSDKLIMFHTGFLFLTSQSYHGLGLAGSMRSDLILDYERIILKDLTVSKNWFDLMIKNKWLEQPPIAPNRKELAKNQ
ncbi:MULTISPECIES: DUF3231 family protein [unclassified Paenibacillus]|uniref:DUF3231 family protein n=1 Tax=unclassified Paenibacillus TaxID=185978 RepID=UPI000708DD67|nr:MULTISPECIES: DUF3231 family protein [unclassified Paenibacillus]KQX46687.1 hypothetical protein ASD40_15430 [Paenibacillus sp. Root444D2]KRE34138.1 hypothetical protein ASG85_12220 [Paenibacillus sp. Soil724D2]